jgi:hypothetical protein
MLARRTKALLFAGVLPSLTWLGAGVAHASEVVEVLPLTDQILMVRFDDGSIRDDRFSGTALDVSAASQPGSYKISSTDDGTYSSAKAPTQVKRKSKATEFADLCESWNNTTGCVNKSVDHAKEHWIYLFLPSPLTPKKNYKVDVGGLATNGATHSFSFDPDRVRSEAVHVNLIGYPPSAPRKHGYVYHWMGDGGGLSLSSYQGKQCRVVKASDGSMVHQSTLVFRKAATNQETGQTADTKNGNFLGAEVYECDFSSFRTPGEYRVAVDGIGASFPFRIAEDVYRGPFYYAMKGLFMNRSGIAISEKHGDGYPRPVPHHPSLTPGFAGKLKYSTTRHYDVHESDAYDGDKSTWEAGLRGDLNTWGWYQDAGDWDAYPAHSRVPLGLLFLYEAYPGVFFDSELNIPESGNGLPDLLDEARWLIRFYHRTRHAILDAGYGTGGVGGARVMGDLWGDNGYTSWTDTNRMWVVSGEDPWMTYRYAGLAAQLAYVLAGLGKPDPEGIDWSAEARAAYTWAKSNTRSGDETRKWDYDLKMDRAYAAAALYRLTGETSYHDQFLADYTGGTIDRDPQRYAPYLYSLMPSSRTVDATMLSRCHTALKARANVFMVGQQTERATRWGGNWYMPMVVGQGSSPLVDEAVITRGILEKAGDKATADSYLPTIASTADYFLGTNPLNMTWVPQLGPRYPVGIFRLDSWRDGKDGPTPGYIPYGPTSLAHDMGGIGGPVGPWRIAWITVGNKIYPSSLSDWPGHEQWFDMHTAVMSSETTVGQTMLPTAITYGSLLSVNYTAPAGTGGSDAGGTGGTGGNDSGAGGSQPADGSGGETGIGAGPGDGTGDDTYAEYEGLSTSGCGCSVPGGSQGARGLWPLLLLFALRRRPKTLG